MGSLMDLTNYILIVDDEEDILDMLEMIVSSTINARIEKASSGNRALEAIAINGEPCLIISDYKMPDGDGFYLFEQLKKNNCKSPFIVCSGNPSDQLASLFPDSVLVIQKPNIMRPLKQYLQTNFSRNNHQNEHVTVPIGLLRRLGFVKFDIFIQLNESKYVKVFCAGDALDKEDCDRVETKFLNKLFMLKQDVVEVVREFEVFLSSRLLATQGELKQMIVPDVLKTTSLLCKAIGWNSECIALAMKTVEITSRYLESKRDLYFLLECKDDDYQYSHHVAQLSLLCCVVAHNIGWHSEVTQQKLVIASMLHDHYVDPQKYDDIELLRIGNREPKHDKDYFQHPIKAAELARTLKGLPSDIDHILLEHHERPDGSGFPRGLSSSRISSLSALFIICEALFLYFQDKDLTPESLESFFMAHADFSSREPFKKIITSIKTGATSARN